jgi:alcohol dehydrogenase class IV
VGNVHAIAHSLGALYNVPHGLANAIIMPWVLDFYGPAGYEKLADLADAAGIAGEGNEAKAKAFIAEIRAMNERMGIPKTFDCIKEEDLPGIAKHVLHEANPLYPVPVIMKKDDVLAIVRQVMA